MGWPTTRGTRAGKQVQRKRAEREWREAGWTLHRPTGWWYAPGEAPEEEEEEEEEDFEEVEVEEPLEAEADDEGDRPQEVRDSDFEDLPSSPLSPTSSAQRALEAALEEARRQTLREALEKEELRRKVSALERQLRAQRLEEEAEQAAELSAPTAEAAARLEPAAPAEVEEAAEAPSIRTQESLTEVEVTVDSSRSRSNLSSDPPLSKWSSAESENLTLAEPLRAVEEEEVDYSPDQIVFESEEEDQLAPKQAARALLVPKAVAAPRRELLTTPKSKSAPKRAASASVQVTPKGKGKRQKGSQAARSASSDQSPRTCNPSSSSRALARGRGEGTSSSSRALNVDFRLERGDVFGDYIPRPWELRTRRRDSSSEEPERTQRRRTEAAQVRQWETDDRRWPLHDRVIGFDFHGTLQVKRGNRWIVPLSHLELIRHLRELQWKVYLISYVGSKKREASTRLDIHEPGLAREIGEEGRDWFLVWRREDKAAKCRELGIDVFLDDSSQVIAALRSVGVTALAINANEEHEDGYRDVASALHIERILYRTPVQDR